MYLNQNVFQHTHTEHVQLTELEEILADTKCIKLMWYISTFKVIYFFFLGGPGCHQHKLTGGYLRQVVL